MIFLILETGIEIHFQFEIFQMLFENMLLFKMPCYKAPMYIRVQNK